jgi:hypothetical protein
MPILNLKGYGKRKPNEKTRVNTRNTEGSSRVWDIGTGVPNNEQTLNHIRQFLLANREWTFVWCHRRPTDNNYFLSGYIVFQAPHSSNWIYVNLGSLGRGIYSLTQEEPNHFRDREMNMMEEYVGMGYEIIILIDDGHFQ